MAYQKLQIKLLSKTGELLRCINCFGGQVTVLRGYSNVELQPFQRMFAGVAGPERIVATVDGEPYSPAMAALVGFGESFQVGITVHEFLTHAGLAPGSIPMNLQNFGIEVSPEHACVSLSTDFQRRLRLLATFVSESKIIVLNNPFEEIASGWRERFAEEIASLTRSHRRIVVIPSLSHRPEHWINNDLISRIQVGQNNQRTVGFGSAPGEMNDLVKQLRAAFQDESQVQKILQQTTGGTSPTPPIPTTPATPATPSAQTEQTVQLSQQREPALPQQPTTPPPVQKTTPSHKSAAIPKRKIDLKPILKILKWVIAATLRFVGRIDFKRYRYPIAGTFCLLLLFMFGLRGMFQEDIASTATSQSDEQVRVASASTTRNSPQEPDNSSSEHSRAPSNADPAAGIKKATPPPGFLKNLIRENSGSRPSSEVAPSAPASGGAYVLDLYPTAVKQAILQSFNTEHALPRPRAVTGSTSKEPEDRRGSDDLFSLLASTSGSGKDLPPTKSQPPNFAINDAPNSKRPLSSLSREEIEERRRKIRQKFLEAIERRAQQKNGL